MKANTIIKENLKTAEGERLTRSYRIDRYLGKGGFACVYELVCEETSVRSAAKIIPKSSLKKQSVRAKLMSEITIHRSLHHENIVKFEHVFEDESNIYILLELCSQSLKELLNSRKRLTEEEAKTFLCQLTEGLRYLHSQKVIHRDIKLGNLFLTDTYELKIGDFGLATRIEREGQRRKTVCGTPNYIAPEILDPKEGYSFEVDVWSLGVVAYTLAVGKPPFEAKRISETYNLIKSSDFSFPSIEGISENYQDIVKLILSVSPESRPSLKEISFHFSVPKQSFKENISKVMVSDRSQIAATKRVATYSGLNGRLEGKTWVQKWLDYSCKYGVIYLLSSGTFGILFNDSTSMTSSSGTESFQYFCRPGNRREHSISNYPDEYSKKVGLFQHFSKYFQSAESKSKVVVDKCIVTSKAIAFALSTKVVHIWFNDKTEILLNLKTENGSYLDKYGIISTTCAAFDERPDFAKRLRYTKKIVYGIINGSKTCIVQTN